MNIDVMIEIIVEELRAMRPDVPAEYGVAAARLREEWGLTDADRAELAQRLETRLGRPVDTSGERLWEIG